MSENYTPGNIATYNPTNAANYNAGGSVNWSASMFHTNVGVLMLSESPEGVYNNSNGYEEFPYSGSGNEFDSGTRTISVNSPFSVTGFSSNLGNGTLNINYFVSGGPPTVAEYNAGTAATYNAPTVSGYNAPTPTFTPGNAIYTPGNIASYNPTNIASYNPTNISGYNTQNIAGYNAGGGGVNWNATVFYEVERRVSNPAEPLEYSVFVNNVNYESGWSASCPSPFTTTNGVINSVSGGLQYYEINYECTPAGGSGGPNYNTGSIANYIGNTENYNPATIGNYSGNSVNYNPGSAGNYTGNNTAGFAPGGNPATYNTGNPGNYNPTFVGGFSGNTISGYTGNNAGYNTGSPATYTGNIVAGYNPAPPPSYNLGNPASYTSNFVSGYNSGNPATYTGNSIASYSGNFVASYNPGSASTYNFPIPGTPGEPGYAFGVYFPGGGVCAPGVYVNEQEVSYYFENQEIDYRDHPIEVPAGGQIVVRIE